MWTRQEIWAGIKSQLRWWGLYLFAVAVLVGFVWLISQEWKQTGLQEQTLSYSQIPQENQQILTAMQNILQRIEILTKEDRESQQVMLRNQEMLYQNRELWIEYNRETNQKIAALLTAIERLSITLEKHDQGAK